MYKICTTIQHTGHASTAALAEYTTPDSKQMELAQNALSLKEGRTKSFSGKHELEDEAQSYLPSQGTKKRRKTVVKVVVNMQDTDDSD